MVNQNIENRIINLANKISGLSNVDRKNIIEFADHNEWGLALDTLCSQIYEYGIVITKDIYEEIKQLGNCMEIDETTWSYLKTLVK